MKKTVPIKLSSLPTIDIVLTCLTVKQTQEIISYSDYYFEYIFQILKITSNLADKEIHRLYIGEAVSLLVYYRMFFWDDLPLATVSINGKDQELLPSDFIGSEESVDTSTEYTINGYRFTPFITLKMAMDAEKMALRNPQTASKNLRQYVLASGCTKSFQEGLKAIEGANVTPDVLGSLKSYSDDIGKISPCKLDMLSSNGKINIIGEKGGEPFALGFRGSQLFSFWV